MRRARLWLLLIFTGSLLLLLHSGPVERRLLAFLQGQAARFGLFLNADALHWNLFRLSLRAEKLNLTGPGFALRADRFLLNGNHRLLGGTLALDELHLEGFSLILQPQDLPAGSGEAMPAELPAIRLKSLALDGAVQVAGSNTPVDLQLHDLSLNYRNSELDLAAQLVLTDPPAWLPKQLLLSLAATSTDFKVFSPFSLSAEAPAELLAAEGRLVLGEPPDLNVEYTSNRLFPAHMLARWKENTLHGVLTASPDLAGSPLPLHLSFSGRTNPLELGAEISASPHGSARLDFAAPDRALLHIRELHLPRLLPQLDPLLQKLDLHAQWQGGKATFSGQVVGDVPFSLAGQWDGSHGSVDLSGGSDGTQYSAQLEGGVRGGQGFFQLRSRQGDLFHQLGMPKEWTYSQAELSTEFALSRNGLNFEKGRFQLGDLSVVGESLGDVQGTLSGPLDNLAFTLSLPAMQAQGSVDFLGMALGNSCLEFTGKTMHLLGLEWAGRGQVNLEGPLVALQGRGELDIELQAPELPAPLSSHLMLESGAQGWPNSTKWHLQHGRMGSLSLSGEGEIVGRHWPRLQLSLDHPPSPNPLQLQGTPLPFFQFHLNSSESIEVSLELPPQQWTLGNSRFDLAGLSPLKATFDPGRQLSMTSDFAMTLAGLRLDHLGFRHQGVETELQATLHLENAAGVLALLPATLQRDLELASLQAQVALAWGGAQPRFSLRSGESKGSWRHVPFTLQDIGLVYDGVWRFSGLSGSLAGFELTCESGTGNQALQQALGLQGLPSDDELTCTCEFELKDPNPLDAWLNEFSGERGKVVDRAQGQFFFGLRPPTTAMRAALAMEELSLTYRGVAIRGQELNLAWDQAGLHLLPGKIELDGHPLTLVRKETGISMHGRLPAAQLAPFLPGLSGSGGLAIEARLNEIDGSTHLALEQVDGPLLFPDPPLALMNLQLKANRYPEGKWTLEQANGNLNDGSFHLAGEGSGQGYLLRLFGQDIDFAYDDVQARLTASLQLQRQGETPPLITGAVILADGLFSPQVELVRLVQDLVSETSGIFFPDPLLSEFRMLINLQTENPLIVDHPAAFLELVSPSVLITGTLAEPVLNSGALFVNAGSSIKLGKDVLVFQSSQVYFHPNRPDDPYLQIFLEYGDGFSQSKTLQLLGYTSDLEGSFDQRDLTGFLANYLLGRVSSRVSLESEDSASTLNQGFNVVLSQPLGRKLVTRYALPLDGSAGHFELGVGPYLGNLLNVLWDDDQVSYDLRKRDRFGLPPDSDPLIDKISFKAAAEDRRFLRKFLLSRGDSYRETRVRYALSQIERALMAEGYLHPKLGHSFAQGNLEISLERGGQTRIEIEPPLTDEERKIAFKLLKYAQFGADARLANWLQKTWVLKGYPAAVLRVTRQDGAIAVYTTPGPRLQEVLLDFGEAQTLLAASFAKASQRIGLVTDYLASPGETERLLRAELAAAGYVHAALERGRWAGGTFHLPVRLGPMAKLTGFERADDPLQLEARWTDAPFSRGLLDEISTHLRAQLGPGERLRLSPFLDGDDVRIRLDWNKTAEPKAETVRFSGSERISPQQLQRFLHFKKGDGLARLTAEQEQLMQTGAFKAVRLLHEGDEARFEMEESNRWDLEYGLSLSEAERLGVTTQFRDKMFLAGLNELNLRGNWSEEAWSMTAQVRLRRLFGSRIDFYTRGLWNRTFRDEKPIDIAAQFEMERHFRFPENRSILFEASAPLGRFHEWRLGYEYRQSIVHEKVVYHTDFGVAPYEPIDPQSVLGEPHFFQVTNDLAPLKLSYIYKKLDHKTNPRQGTLATLSLEQYLKLLGSENNINGPRFSASFTHFQSWRRLMWSQRYKAGAFFPEVHLEPSGLAEDPLLFTLGGPSTLRGYDAGTIGPYRLEGDPAVGQQIVFLGGEAFWFASHELSQELPWFGLGLSPFVDAGNVWANADQVSLSDAVLSAGIGLYWNSPIGYLRLDWARRLADNLPEHISANPDLDPGKSLHLRFGRTF